MRYDAKALGAALLVLQRVPIPQIRAAAFATIGCVAYWKWEHAVRSVEGGALQLAEDLLQLRMHYDVVRIVAHSLGCRIYLEAIRRLGVVRTTTDHLPDEVHLLAPAFGEQEYEGELGDAARDACYIYYTSRDITLGHIYPIVSRGEAAVGYVGLAGHYARTHGLDVSEQFGIFVHTAYIRVLPELVNLLPTAPSDNPGFHGQSAD